MNDYIRRLWMAGSGPRNQAPTADVVEQVATFRIYDPIDSWGEMFGVSAKEFANALDELPDDVNEIRVHINSPGGDVFDGIAILNALRSHPAKVVAIVDGLAASAASFIACGADELIMARNSEMMIHDAWGMCIGNSDEMMLMAADLDRLSVNIASIYAEKSSVDVAVWRAAMKTESWYSAEEAVKLGLADKVEKSKRAAKSMNSFDLTMFNYAGRAAAPEPTTTVVVEQEPPPAVDPLVSSTDIAKFRLLVASTRF